MADNSKLLEMVKVDSGYGEIEVLRDVSIYAEEGQIPIHKIGDRACQIKADRRPQQGLIGGGFDLDLPDSDGDICLPSGRAIPQEPRICRTLKA